MVWCQMTREKRPRKKEPPFKNGPPYPTKAQKVTHRLYLSTMTAPQIVLDILKQPYYESEYTEAVQNIISFYRRHALISEKQIRLLVWYIVNRPEAREKI